jgi:serine/threonine protein kinase
MARPDQTQQWGRDGHGSSSHRGSHTGGRTGGWGNHPPLHSVMKPPQPPPSRWPSHTPGRITTDAYVPTTESDAVAAPQSQSPQPASNSEEWDAEAKAVHGWERMTRTIAHYRRIEQIGEGTYGQVYQAQCLDTGRIVAMKKIRLHHGGYWGMPPTVIREIKILKRLRHPCMVEMLEVVSSKGVEHLDEEDEREDDRRRRRKEQADKEAMNGSPNNTSDIASNIKKDVVSSSKKKGSSKADRVVDAREGYKGNLFLVLEYVSHDLTGLMDMAYRFTEVQAKCIFRQLLDVLAYMHEAKYVHRDIKSSNILIDSHFRVKLADFGLARCIEPPILDNANE